MSSCVFLLSFLLALLHRQGIGDLQHVEQHCGVWIVSEGYGLPKYVERMVQNDVTIFYHDNRMVSKMPSPDWLSSEGQKHWKEIQDWSDYNKDVLTLAYNSVVQQFNQTGSLSDVNLYQSYGCCWLYPDGTYRASLTHAFNGKDVLSFDIEHKMYVAIVPQAFAFRHLRHKDPETLDIAANYYKKTCRERLNEFRHAPQASNKKVPDVRIIEKQSGDSTLVTCHVSGFYPRAVRVDWLGPDLQLVDGGVTGVLPSGDNTYQTRKSMVVTQDLVGKHSYSCVVHHSSVPGNITTIWVGQTRSRIAVWVFLAVSCLLGIGIVFVLLRRRYGDVLH